MSLIFYLSSWSSQLYLSLTALVVLFIQGANAFIHALMDLLPSFCDIRLKVLDQVVSKTHGFIISTDCYFKDSIKAHERRRRGMSQQQHHNSNLLLHISLLTWGCFFKMKYKNKEQLCTDCTASLERRATLFSRAREKTPKFPSIQAAFRELGVELSRTEDVYDSPEHFACHFYAQVNGGSGQATKTQVQDDLYWLPPCRDCLIPHID